MESIKNDLKKIRGSILYANTLRDVLRSLEALEEMDAKRLQLFLTTAQKAGLGIREPLPERIQDKSELREILLQQIRTSEKDIANGMGLIDRVEDPRAKAILTAHYVGGESWAEVAARSGYTYRTIERITLKAYQDLAYMRPFD